MAYAQEKINPYNGDKRPKGEQVEAMFDNIAPTYDLLNHWLSFGIDRFWRKAAINAMRCIPHADLLDVATGTGDFAILQAKELTPRNVIATDLSEGMMEVGRRKVEKAGLKKRVHFQREDCMALSFNDNTFDAVTVAYGVRNFQDLDKGLSEIHRVLKPGGSAIILELCTPRKFPMKQLFWLYARAVMPIIGRIVSNDFSAYSYLPATMKAFPQGEVMRKILLTAGFGEVSFRRFTFGLSTLYIAKKTEA